MTVTIETTAGPDAGSSLTLPPGRHLLGRSRQSSFVIADPAVEPHHVLLDVDAAGEATATQLAGRVPIVFAGSVLELGDSRLELSPAVPERGDDRTGGGTDAVDAMDLVDVVDVTAPGFAAALAAAAERRRAQHLAAWRAGELSLGVGTVRLAIRLVDDAGRDLSAGALPVHLQQLVDAAERHHGLPVLLARGCAPVIAVVDTDPGSGRGGAVARRLTTAGHGAVRLLTEGQSVPAECTALLEVGARWRGRWIADLTCPEVSLRLHLAGRSVAGADGRALVAEQVPRSVAAIGGDVTRVPQTARRE